MVMVVKVAGKEGSVHYSEAKCTTRKLHLK